jgi:hypothetical protein
MPKSIIYANNDWRAGIELPVLTFHGKISTAKLFAGKILPELYTTLSM